MEPSFVSSQLVDLPHSATSHLRSASRNFANASMAATPPSSIFNVPELVGLVAQYLSSHDIAQCMATCRAWTPYFEPYIWQDIELDSSYPAPKALALNRHRIRSLSVASNDFANLHTLAADLGDRVSSDLWRALDYSATLTTTGKITFPNLRILQVDYESEENASDSKKRESCLDCVLRILGQSPGLLQLAPPENILSLSHHRIAFFLCTLAHKLPCIKELDIRGEKVPLDIGLLFLQVCLNHSQLVNLHCDVGLVGQREYYTAKDFEDFNDFLKSIEDDKKAREATGKPVLGSPIKSLILPKTNEGYPPIVICTLLKSYLPNLERLHVPDISEDRDESFTRSLEEAVAQGCPKLQHLRCSWYEGDGYIEEVINSIVEGCKQWGLKSFYCEDIDDRGLGILEILLENHYNTLEEVELVNCRKVQSNDLGVLLSCKNLKRVKIQQSTSDGAAIEFQHVEFRCRDLKELQLTLHRPDIDPLHDPFGSDDEEEDEEEDEDRVYERFSSWEERKAKEAYAQIGSLSKLESLSLNGDTVVNGPKGQSHNNDLTLEHGWLQKLEGLKELKHFHMAADFWSDMGQAEVEFMDTQWPKLESIEFSCQDLEDIVEKPHWRWLKERRPYLEYRQGSM
ncbi:MAG: hypothetical protein J3Q66DRAFT_137810 [Benniella sp.]|nr:MAG: hypothetical protein J3Q66DRAFT_137810 [Benniella sp.]